VNPRDLREFVFTVGVQISAVTTGRMAQKNFGGQPRDRDGSFFEDRSPLQQRGL
jgi:hypothetical protein